jgi:hypothetical protein
VNLGVLVGFFIALLIWIWWNYVERQASYNCYVATTTFFTPRRLIRCRSAASWLTSPSVKAGSPYHVKNAKNTS